MKKFMQRYAVLLIIICAVWGCKKPTDTTDNGNDSPVVCTPLPECNSPIGIEYYTEDTVWLQAAASQQIADKVVLWKHSDQGLVIYNTSSHATTSLGIVTHIFAVRWSGDWILYNRWVDGGGSGEIYKIRPDGTGNQLLTAGPNRFYPVISPSHDKFLYDTPPGPVIMDFDGNMIRQVHSDQNVNIIPCDWYSDTLMLCASDDKIYTMNLYSGHLEEIISNTEVTNSYFGFPVYVGNNQFVWQSISGLKKTDMTTGITTTIVPSCNSVIYGTGSYNAANNRILCTKTTVSNKEGNPCKQSTKTDLLWISPDGAAREIVDIEL